MADRENEKKYSAETKGYTDKIYEAVTSNENYAASGLKIKKTDTMQNALEIAKNSSEAGDIVSLCPACPAFDQFKTFEYRLSLIHI